jgi:hypothetical protein
MVTSIKQESGQSCGQATWATWAIVPSSFACVSTIGKGKAKGEDEGIKGKRDKRINGRGKRRKGVFKPFPLFSVYPFILFSSLTV